MNIKKILTKIAGITLIAGSLIGCNENNNVFRTNDCKIVEDMKHLRYFQDIYQIFCGNKGNKFALYSESENSSSLEK